MNLIGQSYSKCLLDIYEGTVNHNDVLVIISKTKFDPYDSNHFDELWESYINLNPIWSKYSGNMDVKKEFHDLTKYLDSTGKLHQPRNFGVNIIFQNTLYHWIKAVQTTVDEIQNHNIKNLNEFDNKKAKNISEEDLNLINKLSI